MAWFSSDLEVQNSLKEGFQWIYLELLNSLCAESPQSTAGTVCSTGVWNRPVRNKFLDNNKKTRLKFFFFLVGFLSIQSHLTSLRLWQLSQGCTSHYDALWLNYHDVAATCSSCSLSRPIPSPNWGFYPALERASPWSCQVHSPTLDFCIIITSERSTLRRTSCYFWQSLFQISSFPGSLAPSCIPENVLSHVVSSRGMPYRCHHKGCSSQDLSRWGVKED